MAADRGAYIDQSQSMNIHMTAPTYAKLTSMHFHYWKLGLKTGLYYLRTRPAVDPLQFTINKLILRNVNDKKSAQEKTKIDCNKTSIQNECFMCSS